MDQPSIQVEVIIPGRHRGRGRGQASGAMSAPNQPKPPRIPRVARLMALAIKFQDMVDRGEVRDYAEIARLGYVTRARMSQIMNLLLLAPDIQELLLFAEFRDGAEPPAERHLRAVASLPNWEMQRRCMNKTREYSKIRSCN